MIDPVFFTVAFVPFLTNDPSPNLWRRKARSRQFECERLSADAAREAFPGRIKRARARGDYIERSAMVCNERWMRYGLREARDEAILATLGEESQGFAASAASVRPDLAEHTWLVEVFYPSGPVSAKIGFATKNALMEQGLMVSDRTPMLGVGDIAVLTRQDPAAAYPGACQRYYATGALGDDDALLAVVTRDLRATRMHAAVCEKGRWMWLR